MDRIRYMVADDHSIFRQGLKLALNDDPALDFLGEAADGAELLAKLESINPDVVLLDLKMPRIDGIEATREIKQRYPQVKILILTMHDDEQFILHLLEIGAHGYLLKNVDADEIKLAMHAVYENGCYFSDHVSRIMLKTLVQKSKTTPQFKKEIVLNDRELDVLHLICEGLTAVEIGKQIYLSHRTVEGIRASIQEKIGVRNNAGLIMYAFKNGIVE